MELAEDLRLALLPWSNPTFLKASIPIQIPITSLTLMTDASEKGWSGVLQPLLVEGSWSKLQLQNSMNWLELKAIHLSLQAFFPQIRGCCISLRSDNQTILSCIKKQGSLASQELWSLSREILEFCLEHEIFLSPRHIRGVLNVLADKGSRRVPISTEWSLDNQSFLEFCEEWGFPQVDLMATWENSKLSKYVSPCPDFKALGWDIFSFGDWNLWDSIYVFPPWDCLEEICQRLRLFQGRGFVIAPLWSSKPWFPLLAERCPHRFPLPEGHSLSQETTEGMVFHRNVSFYKLHAWRL